MTGNIFPKWMDLAAKFVLPPFAGGGALVAAIVIGIGGHPSTTDVGYQPPQPVPFSHKLHAGELGLDCRYCHSTVEKAGHAMVPPTATCMNCHASVRTDSRKLELVRESFSKDKPLEWIKIHDLADFAYFNHSAHVSRGIGCVSCHGRIDKMDVVYQHENLSMSWCLDCHRNPEKHLRPVSEVTNMNWKPENQLELGKKLRVEHNINPSTDCSTCHR